MVKTRGYNTAVTVRRSGGERSPTNHSNRQVVRHRPDVLPQRLRGDSSYETPGSNVWPGETCAAVCAEAALAVSACVAEALGAAFPHLDDDIDLCIVTGRLLGSCTDLLRCPCDREALHHTYALARVAADAAADCARVARAHRSLSQAWRDCATVCHRAASALDAWLAATTTTLKAAERPIEISTSVEKSSVCSPSIRN